MRKPSLISLICLLLPLFAAAQKARFEFFTTADGLAGNNTATVTQDDRGFLWLVNDGKLHRYDGRNFLVFPLSAEFSATQEPFLGVASYRDSLLFVWSDLKAFLFHPGTAKWQPVALKERPGNSEEVVLHYRMGTENILISCPRNGLYARILLLKNNSLEPARLPRNAAALNTYYCWYDIDAAGNSLLVARDTFYRMDASGNILNLTPLNNICTNCHNLCFQYGADGSLILMANWLFFRLDEGKNRFVPHPASRFLPAGQYHLHRFILEKNGSIWACGQDRNLIYYDIARDTLYNYHNELKVLLPNPNDFKGLFQDRSGIIWIDTRLGLLKVRPQIYPFDTYFDGLNPAKASYSFRGLTEDSRGCLYGVYYNGIAQFDPAKRQATRLYPIRPVLHFFDLYAQGEMIWGNGGEFLDTQTGRFQSVPSDAAGLETGDNGFFSKDRNGTLWWAAHYLLLRLNESENGFHWTTELQLPGQLRNRMDAFHAGMHSGQLWMAFNGKLLQYDPRLKEQRWFEPKNWRLPVTRILAIREAPDGQLWLGTDAGLVRFDSGKDAARRYTVSDGLPNDFICGLLAQGDSCLWLSTNHGLSRFHIPSETFINFFEEDGLSSNEFNRMSYFQARGGRMFFGGMRGLNAFFPEDVIRTLRDEKKGVEVVLSAFEYTDERRDTILRTTAFARQPVIHLRHWDWSYTFEYAVTDYENPKEVLYSYKMEGYKDGWSAPSRFNFARYNSLPPGEYVFRVKARDSRGRWYAQELAVKVVVHPPWWATWWAYALCAVAIGALLYFLRRYELNRQFLKTRFRIGQLETEKLRELDQFKSRLYTNLTHEFRTPLTVILGMVEQIRAQPKKYLEEGVRLIENNGRNLLCLINQLLDLSKLEDKSFQLHPQQADVIPFLRYVTESFQTYANGQNLSLRFFSPIESLVMDYDPEQLKQALANLISNALKFTLSGGEIIVRVTKPDDLLRIEVRDNGIGISKEDLPHVFDRFYQVDDSHTRKSGGTGIGLAHTSELVKIMGGAIQVESEPGQGSSFVVSLPVTRSAPANEGLLNLQSLVNLPDEGLLNLQSLVNLPGQSTLPQLLLIEDNPDVVAYLKSFLENLYRLDVAYNGKIGLEKALENIPDLIISDVMMPEKDGYSVCDTLKNDERTSHIPIILLTAKADTAAKIAGLRRGADAYLTKPFDKEELLVRLEMLAERQKRMAAHFSKNLLSATAAAGEPETEEDIRIENAFMEKVRQIVVGHYADENFALPQLCLKIGMSRSQLFRKMQAVSNTSPSDFIRSFRLARAKTLLETTGLTVSEVAWRVGYKDVAHFSRSYFETFGVSPSAGRK